MSPSKSRPAVMEPIEGRKLMSVTLADAVVAQPTLLVRDPQIFFPAYMSGSTLIVQGRATDDQIELAHLGSSIVVANNGHTSFWNAATITSIRVNAGDGNDSVVIQPSVTKPTTIYCGTGADVAQGGSGNDAVYGGDGNDNIKGGAGHDYLDGEAHDDRLDGEAGNDTVYGRDGHDTGNGGTGHDILYGSFGNDRLDGGDGNDDLHGGWGNDHLTGGIGTDDLFGGWGHDRLDGGADADLLDGDLGDDVLIGGAGIDQLNGGDNNDTFYASGDGLIDNIDGGLGFDTAYVDPTTYIDLGLPPPFNIVSVIPGDNVTGVEQVFS